MDRTDDTLFQCDEIHPARETVHRLKNPAVLARNEEIRKEGDTHIRKEVEHIDALNQVLNTHRKDAAPSPESVDAILPANKASRTIRLEGERRSSSSDESESIIPPSLSGRAKRGSAEMERRDVKDIKTPPIPWIKWFCGIGPEHPALPGVPSSKLIYPLSVFGMGWTGVTALLLLYTGLVTPAVIAFHWLDDACVIVPTLPIDVFIDCCFLVDILVTMSTGVMVANRYTDNWGDVLKTYNNSGQMAFDCLTSFPVSFFELAVAEQCKSADVGEDVLGVDNAQLRFIRAMKPLRWFKLMRIIRLGRSAAVANKILDYFNISPRAGRGAKVVCSLVAFIHVAGCFIWLVKVLVLPEEDVHLFLETKNWLNDESPDLNTVQGKFDTYILCVYFVTVVTLTVGFGDITPDCNQERIALIVLMILSSFVWGTLLAQVSEIHRTATLRDQAKLVRISSVVDFLNENLVPHHLRQQIVHFERCALDSRSTQLREQEVVHNLPPQLKTALVTHLSTGVFKNLPIFKYLRSSDVSEESQDSSRLTVSGGDVTKDPLFEDDSERFLSDVWSSLEYNTYEDGGIIIPFGSKADRLIIIHEGHAILNFETNDGKPRSMELSVREFIGECALLGEKSWARSSKVNASHATDIQVKAGQFVTTLELTREKFQEILAKSPLQVKKAIERFEMKYVVRTKDRWQSLVKKYLDSGLGYHDIHFSSRTEAPNSKEKEVDVVSPMEVDLSHVNGRLDEILAAIELHRVNGRMDEIIAAIAPNSTASTARQVAKTPNHSVSNSTVCLTVDEYVTQAQAQDLTAQLEKKMDFYSTRERLDMQVLERKLDSISARLDKERADVERVNAEKLERADVGRLSVENKKFDALVTALHMNSSVTQKKIAQIEDRLEKMAELQEAILAALQIQTSKSAKTSKLM